MIAAKAEGIILVRPMYGSPSPRMAWHGKAWHGKAWHGRWVGAMTC
jgi:hypothetical protein